jgi:hypothetical protein
MTSRYCPKHGIVDATGCSVCRTDDITRRNRRNTRYGYGRSHWKQVRVERLARAGHVCELRLPGCTRHASHVHLDPRLQGDHDRATFADVRACCSSCSGAVDAPRASRVA